MKIMFLGDTHKNNEWYNTVFEVAVKYGVEKIVQLGDFGFWEPHNNGYRFLKNVSKKASKFQIPVYWIDGNHENHVVLRNKYINDPSKRTPQGFVNLRPNLYHIPRGLRWEWDGVKFLGVGGAYSIDRNRRTIGESWFWEEEISDDDVEAAIGDGSHVDVMVSHDAPSGVDLQLIFQMSGNSHYKMIPECEKQRLQLRKVVDEVKPGKLFHGHYHADYTQDLVVADDHLIKVRGLGCEFNMGAIHIDDTQYLRKE